MNAAPLFLLNVYLEREVQLHPFDSSPHFPNTRLSGDQQVESLLDFNDDNGICKLPVVPLYWCNNNKEPNFYEFNCGACRERRVSTSYYACLECEKKFHKKCVESPPEIMHPFHPFHPLKLSFQRNNSVHCFCGRATSTELSYHCTTCDVSMHLICAKEPVPIVINHPKSHPHPLTFFPRQATLACNICGLIKTLHPTYICTGCVFVIHKDCIGFPHVIRISRHHHHISFASSLPSQKLLSCGVCRRQVDNDYGAYSCNKCDAYFVHSKCALHPDVWDGKELQGVPEEDDMIDDGEPFERIADGIILHPFHSHHLRLEISIAYDEKKFCRGCAIPIYEGQYYSCMECEFILHESCANAPRMKRHPLHPHPLTLSVATKGEGNYEGSFVCSACHRQGNGFFYRHIGARSFTLDLQCASVIEPFEYQGHKHPLFLGLDQRDKGPCQLCKYESYDSKLNCMECDYVICFSCATLPYKARYKHDSHFLTICDGKEAIDQLDWCEVCEGKIEEVKEVEFSGRRRKQRRFYKCNDCCTALHVECLLGIDIYMKPGETIQDYISVSNFTFQSENREWIDVCIYLNTSLTRPICDFCWRRCPYPIVLQGYDTIFCTLDCIQYWLRQTSNEVPFLVY